MTIKTTVIPTAIIRLTARGRMGVAVAGCSSVTDTCGGGVDSGSLIELLECGTIEG